MSRFDEISPLWQNFKSFWAICLMVYLVFGNFLYPLWHFYTTGQIVIVVVGQIWLSGHTDDDVDAAAVCRCQIKISSTNRSKNCYRTANVRNNLLPSFVLRNILCWQKKCIDTVLRRRWWWWLQIWLLLRSCNNWNERHLRFKSIFSTED